MQPLHEPGANRRSLYVISLVSLDLAIAPGKQRAERGTHHRTQALDALAHGRRDVAAEPARREARRRGVGPRPRLPVRAHSGRLRARKRLEKSYATVTAGR